MYCINKRISYIEIHGQKFKKLKEYFPIESNKMYWMECTG